MKIKIWKCRLSRLFLRMTSKVSLQLLCAASYIAHSMLMRPRPTRLRPHPHIRAHAPLCAHDSYYCLVLSAVLNKNLRFTLRIVLDASPRKFTLRLTPNAGSGEEDNHGKPCDITCCRQSVKRNSLATPSPASHLPLLTQSLLALLSRCRWNTPTVRLYWSLKILKA